MNLTDDSITAFLVVGFIFAIYAVVGTMDYHDEVAKDEHYCQMVADGYWPRHADINCEK